MRRVQDRRRVVPPYKPFNDIPTLPPERDVETRAVLKACVSARAALAEVRIAGQLIPNQAILINSIPVLEAQASSEIENIVTTTDRLFRFANDADGPHRLDSRSSGHDGRDRANPGPQDLFAGTG